MVFDEKEGIGYVHHNFDWNSNIFAFPFHNERFDSCKSNHQFAN